MLPHFFDLIGNIKQIRKEELLLIAKTTRKLIFTVTLKERLQLFLFLRNSSNNIALHTLFLKINAKRQRQSFLPLYK